MRTLTLAVLMVAQLQAVAQTPAPVVPADWAERKVLSSPDAMKQAIRDGVRATLAEEDKADSVRRDPRVATRFGKLSDELDAIPSRPSCLGPNGLSRQNTYIFGGVLTLPFLVVAAVTGKCN